MTKERRLGRGLEALLGRPAEMKEAQDDGWHMAAHRVIGDPGSAGGGLVHLSVYEVDSNPFQPRRDFDEAAIAELSESIKAHGLLQPLVVRRHGERWQLVAGERRLRAAIRAGWKEVPAQVREADDRQMAEVAIVENLQRKDLNALEKAGSFQSYLERYQCTQEELATRLSIDRSTVANLIRLLELPAAVQQAIGQGKLSPGHARALLPLGDDAQQADLCRRVVEEGLSVRAVEQLVQEVIDAEDSPHEALTTGTPPAAKRGRPRNRSSQLSLLEQDLRRTLGTKIDIRQAASGKGKIVIHFSSAAEFERLRDQLAAPGLRSQAG